MRALPPWPASRGGEGLAEEGRAERSSRGGVPCASCAGAVEEKREAEEQRRWGYFFIDFTSSVWQLASRDVGTGGGGSPESPDALDSLRLSRTATVILLVCCKCYSRMNHVVNATLS